MSRVMPAVDTVAEHKRLRSGRAFDVLYRARESWMGMEQFRRDRERNKKYTYGSQWDDVVCVDGERMREADLIRKQGNLPLKNNLIRRMVRAVKGVWRSQASEPTCTARDRDEQKYGETMSIVLQCNMDINRMKEVNAQSLEEFLISGFVVHKKTFGWRRENYDCWTDYIQPNNFFIDCNMRDVRGWDVSCLGEIHDVTFEELAQKYAKTPEEYNRLAEIYAGAKDGRYVGSYYEQFGYPMNDNYDFLVPRDTSLCRVIEVWQKESKARYRCHDVNSGEVFKVEVEDFYDEVVKVNEERRREGLALGIPESDIPYIRFEWFVDSYWYYYILTPFGDILDEGETPYEHKEHPYVFVAYPFIDGEIHSYVADVIDQQRYVNRLIMLYDFIMKTSAKGALLFPEDSLPDDMSMDDIAEEWARADGIIVFKPNKSGILPKQLANNCTQIGISELLNMQLKFFEDISGVNGAIQGKPGYSGMSASLYSQQTQNATTSLLDLLDTFTAFIREGAYKDVKNIQQCYDTPKVRNIAGKNSALVEYDPRKMSDIEFDLSIIESTATPTYRAMANEFLMEIWKAGQITLQQLLEHGDFPFADNLLQSVKSQQEQLERGEVPDNVSPEVLRQAQEGADMAAVQKAQTMMAAA
ncbi:MAG: hypothetical protein HDS72_04385 [Bacteroidales bacterium]|nr:hypothetical protein [Bacteroidales bacterium]